MKRFIYIVLFIALAMMIGFIGSSLQSDSIDTWYPFINKSPLTPPSYVFPIAWTILYICMGTSAGIIASSQDKRKNVVITLFLVQLFFNFIWTILFFTLKNPLLGMIDIIILDALIIIYIIKSYPISKTASILFWPYLAWVAFATYLNLYIALYN